jgi:hypothetical protein
MYRSGGSELTSLSGSEDHLVKQLFFRLHFEQLMVEAILHFSQE